MWTREVAGDAAVSGKGGSVRDACAGGKRAAGSKARGIKKAVCAFSC